MSLENYNGFTNVETWALCLHVNNDEDLLNDVQELLKEALANDQALGHTLKEWFEELSDAFWNGEAFGTNLRNMIREVGTHERVDWHEAAWNIMPEDE